MIIDQISTPRTNRTDYPTVLLADISSLLSSLGRKMDKVMGRSK